MEEAARREEDEAKAEAAAAARRAEAERRHCEATARRAAEDAAREEREASERAAAKAEADAAAARQREQRQQKAAAEAAERRRAAEAEAAEKLRLAEEGGAAAEEEASTAAERAVTPEQDWPEAAERQRSAATACPPRDAGTADGLGAPQQSSERQQRHPSVDAQSHATAAHEAERRSREAGAGVNPASAVAAAFASGQRAAHGRISLAQHAQQPPQQPLMQASSGGVSTAGTDDSHPRRPWSLDDSRGKAANGIQHPLRCACPCECRPLLLEQRMMSVCHCTR